MAQNLSPGRAWLVAIRPKTLAAAVAPIYLATAIASLHTFQIRWSISAWALLTTLFLQIGTNLVNDAQDFIRGTDTPQRLGPSRVSQLGWLSPRAVMAAAGLSFLLAFLCGLPLVMVGGWPILALGVLSIVAAYAYTAGPYPLAYHGLGEAFVILFFGLTAVMGLGYLLTGQILLDFLVGGLQLGFLCCALLVINNGRDIEEDRRNHKRTLAARFGLAFARTELGAFFAGAFFLDVYWIYRHCRVAVLMTLFVLPLAGLVFNKVSQNEPSTLWNRYLALSALVLLAFSLLLGTGLFFHGMGA